MQVLSTLDVVGVVQVAVKVFVMTVRSLVKVVRFRVKVLVLVVVTGVGVMVLVFFAVAEGMLVVEKGPVVEITVTTDVTVEVMTGAVVT